MIRNQRIFTPGLWRQREIQQLLCTHSDRDRREELASCFKDVRLCKPYLEKYELALRLLFEYQVLYRHCPMQNRKPEEADYTEGAYWEKKRKRKICWKEEFLGGSSCGSR